MIATSIAAVIGNYMTSLFVLGLIVAGVKIARLRTERSAAVVSGILLNTYLLYAIGCSMAMNFVMHSVFGDFAAKTIGWAQSPFQLELAFFSLGVAVMAFIVHSAKNTFRSKAAVVIGNTIFGLGAFGGHIYQLVANHDLASNNAGLLLYMDFVIPVAGLAIVIWHAVARRHSVVSATDSVVVRPLAATSR